jgi:TonB family protein
MRKVFVCGFVALVLNGCATLDEVPELKAKVRALERRIALLEEAQLKEESVQPDTQTDSNASSQQAVIIETPRVFSAGESVSAPVTDAGTEYFESVNENVPTDLFGEEVIVYGQEIAPERPNPEPSASITVGTEPSLADWSQLDTILFSDGGNGPGEGDGNGTQGNFSVEAGGLIEARNFAELMSQRGVALRYDPDIRSAGLPGGLRSMKVPVEFTIRRDGTVVAVRVADTGDLTLNAQIAQALRRWKFEPIQQEIQQTARLLYVIESVNGGAISEKNSTSTKPSNPWRELRIGMTEAQVTTILGEPDSIYRSANFASWDYKRGGCVDFRHGKVETIQEPWY